MRQGSPVPPLLAYSLELSVAANNGVSYICVGEAATLTLSVSNPGETVTLDSLTLIFSLGADATDLTPAPTNLTANVPSGWTSAWTDTGLQLTPPNGSVSVTPTTGLTFILQVASVNTVVGTTSVGLVETTANQTAYPPSFPIPKMPSGFVLTGLTASPTQIAPGGTVTLTWTGTPNQAYTVNYVGGPASGVSVTAPASGTTAWTSPAIQTTGTSAAFVVSATAQSTTVEASTSVLVSAPQILTFPQPGGCSYGEPVALHWTTVSATSCQLYANGVLVAANAPANTPPGGVPFVPTAPSTTCELYAYNGAAPSPPQSVTVNARLWSPGLSLSGQSSDFGADMVLSNDGTTLYAVSGAKGSLSAIATSTLTVASSAIPTIPGVTGTSVLGGRRSLALSNDNTQLFVALQAVDEGAPLWNSVYGLPVANLAATPTLVAQFGSMVTVGPGGTTLYSLFYTYDSMAPCNSNTVLIAAPSPGTIQSFGQINQTIALTDVQLSADGSTLYTLFSCPAESVLSAIDTATLPANNGNGPGPDTVSTTPVAQPGGPVFVLAPTGAPNANTVYCCAATDASGTIALLPVTVPDNTAQTPITLFTPPAGAAASIIGLAAEPKGGVFALVSISGLTGTPAAGQPGNGLAIFVVNPVTGAASLFYYSAAVTDATVGTMLSDRTGANLYVAAGGSVFQFAKMSGSTDVRATAGSAC